MSFRTVLFAIGTEQGEAELDQAIGIAQALEAHLNVLVLGVAPPPPSSPYGVVSNDIWAAEIRDGQAQAQARAEVAEARLKAAGVSSAVDPQYIDRGTVATLAARGARYADLTLVMPQLEGFEALQTWVMNGALFESGRPILILPGGATQFPRVERIVIGWDASVEASKAVRDAIGLMRAAREVHAVLIDPVPSFDGHGPEPGADLAAYLERHEIAAKVHRLPREGKDAAEVLNLMVAELDAGLVVMGGFGHSRLRQRIFGGATTTMMKSAAVPVLMAH